MAEKPNTIVELISINDLKFETFEAHEEKRKKSKNTFREIHDLSMRSIRTLFRFQLSGKSKNHLNFYTRKTNKITCAFELLRFKYDFPCKSIAF